MSESNIFSNYIENKGNKINFSNIILSEENNEKILKNLIEKNPNITEIDISNCNLTSFPKILFSLKKITTMNIRNNNFKNFDSLINDLSNFVELSDLKIDLSNQNQVILILDKLPSLILLNEKNTKDANSIIDIEEKEIENISLQNDLSLFTEIINKLNLNNLINDFQNKLYEEAEKVKKCLNDNSPNYIYANIVIQSQFKLQKFLSDKFIEKLNDKNQEIAKLLFQIIFNSGNNLVQIINSLYPKIEEKTDNLRNQLQEAWKAADEINDYEKKYKDIFKEKQILSNNYNLLKSKVEKIENENKIMTQQLLKNAKEIYSRNKDTEGNKFPSNQIFKFINLQKNNKSKISKNNNNNINNKNNINNNNDNYNYYNNNDYNNNDYNDNHIFENQNNSNIIKITNNNISHPKTLTIKMTKEIMNEIYNSKSSYDKK